MKSRKVHFIIYTIILFCIQSAGVMAQGCANCKSAVESDLKSGGSIGTGLNTGILYLMAIPYLILMIGAYAFFKKPIDAWFKDKKNRYFQSKAVK